MLIPPPNFARIVRSGRNGFSLVELLIVMVILATVMGMVGGLAVDSFTKHTIKKEKLKLRSFIKNTGNKAFIWERNIMLEASSSIVATKDLKSGKMLSSLEFEKITFPEQVLSFSASGIRSSSQIQYIYDGKVKTLQIGE